MTPGPRGWVVLLFNVVLIAAAAGWYAGGVHAGKKWDQWNYAHVAWDKKGDRAK